MSGDTEETTTAVNSVDSALIWTDNPELEYFRSMMTNRIDNKLSLGLDMEDSLIGDSTVREMLEIDDDESNSRNNGSPLRRFGVRDTSGLSDAESNTVDNIYIGDESIFDMKGSLSKDSDEELDPPITRTHVGRNLYQHQSQEQEFSIPNQHPYHESETRENAPPHRQIQCISPPKSNIPHNDRLDGNGERKESVKIPGFIFVTDGHPSIIRTKPDLQSSKTSEYKEKYLYKRVKAAFIPKILIICLTFVVIIASTVVGVLVYQIQTESSVFPSSSSPRQNDGLPFSSPNEPPASEPSNLRTKYRPEVVDEAPTSYPATSKLQTSGPEPSFIPNTKLPTTTVTTRPTFMTVNSPMPTAMTKNSFIIPPTVVTDSPSISTTSSTSDTSTTVATSSSCVSTVTTDKTCYKNGDSIQILFNNCKPASSDWIGIYPARQGVSNLRQPRSWLWTCGDQLCNDPVVSGEATLFDALGFGSFRAFLIRDDGNTGAGYPAYATGNRFIISSSCN